MNIEKLQGIKEVKNYKAMCELLGEKIKGGDSKKAQIKEWERFIKYHKEGNRFIIDEIYTEPLEKVDGRGSTSIYEDDIQSLIIHECSLSKMENYNSIKLSCSMLANKLKIINENYIVGRNDIKTLSSYMNIPVETIYDFYDSTQRKNKSIIENALNKLQDKALIKWKTEVMLCVNRNKGEYRIALDRDLLIIAEIEQEALQYLGEESKRDVFVKRKWNDFKKKITSLFKEYEINIDYYFDVYNIIATEKFKEMILDENSYKEISERLNNNVAESEIRSCTKRHDKSIEYLKNHNHGQIMGWGFDFYHDKRNKLKDDGYGYKFKSDKAKSSEEYIEDTKKIIDVCIKKNSGVMLENELKNKKAENIKNVESTTNNIPF